MKSLKKVALLALAGGLLVSAKAQPVDPPAPNDNQAPPPADQVAPAEPGNDQAPAPTPAPEPDAAPAPADDADAPPAPGEGMIPPNGFAPAPGAFEGAPQQAFPRTPGSSLSPNARVTLVPPAIGTNSFGTKDLHMNFRDVPLDQVLNYMSDAAGFIIVLETRVAGNVSVWSNQPVSRSEAISLLNSVLNKNGYAAIVDGRTLTIVNRDEARKRDIPVKTGANPVEIPKDAEIVTQIIPVRSLNATQLTRDLAPLLPDDTTLTANEAGNALVMTDTQINIRRIAEIIKALDAVSSSVNSIKVFQLEYADSKAMVTVIKELFPDQGSTPTIGGGNNRGGGGGGRGGRGGAAAFPMMMGGFGGMTGGTGAKPSSRVLAVSDDNSNTVIVSAPDDILPLIADLMRSLDTPITDITELRVFPLKFADPTEMASLLTSLFPDDTSSATGTGNRFQMGGLQMGGRGGNRGGGNNNNGNTSSSRMKKGRVIAVPDPRTSSVVVSADKSLMGQIETMVGQLDANPAKKQRVYVYTLHDADVEDVQPVLEDLFLSSNSRNRSSSQNQNNNALQIRNNQMQQQTTSSQSGFGSGNRSNQ